MRRLTQAFILILISTSYLNVARAIEVNAQIHGVSMNACNQNNEKCFSIKFDKAEMSHWSPLFVFKNYSLSFISKNKSGDKVVYIKGKSGYFDFKMNTVVVRDEMSNKEVLINLKSLERKEFQL